MAYGPKPKGTNPRGPRKKLLEDPSKNFVFGSIFHAVMGITRDHCRYTAAL